MRVRLPLAPGRAGTEQSSGWRRENRQRVANEKVQLRSADLGPETGDLNNAGLRLHPACAEIGETTDPFVSSAARRILERGEW
jgi:hypothetical protein